MKYILIVCAIAIISLLGLNSHTKSQRDEARATLAKIEVANSNLANALDKCEKLRAHVSEIFAEKIEADRLAEQSANKALQSVLDARACNVTNESLKSFSGAENPLINDFNSLFEKLNY